MAEESTRSVLRAMWQAQRQTADVDDLCGPQRNCKNMRDVTFDGFGPPGTDIATAWRDRLRREGKLASPGSTIRDLVLGTNRN